LYQQYAWLNTSVKIDIFCHILPPAFYDRMTRISTRSAFMQKRVREIPVIIDLDARFRVMDQFGDYRQVLSLATPPIEALGGPDETPELARMANDGMAEIVARHPDRFPGFIASLPMNNPEASLQETERALTDLGATGIMVYTNSNGLPIDDPAYLPLFERMHRADLPIWLHPIRSAAFADYASEGTSKLEMWWVFGWPYETSVSMARIVFAGYFDRFPGIKIITHHMGGMVPYFAGRVGPGLDQLGARTDQEDLTVYAKRLAHRPFDYFKMFYADTALFGARPAVECGFEFFGADKVLFASDMPFDPEKGPMFIRETIRNLSEMALSDVDRQKVFAGNARRIMKLTGV
jgi:predicted TIM-barrel fold metal-dependent hydrolase